MLFLFDFLSKIHHPCMKYNRFIEAFHSRKFVRRHIAVVKSWHPNQGWGLLQLLQPVCTSREQKNLYPFSFEDETQLKDKAQESNTKSDLVFMHRNQVFHEGMHPNIQIGMKVEITPKLEEGSTGKRAAYEVTLPGLAKIGGKSFDLSRSSSCAPSTWFARNISCRPFPKKVSDRCEDVDL
ncbi:hypothetical protein XU18_0280 [Perkinsela sp. CCAP 1560/4]|nr:hypothetical protein XU18_0280 [Perkinsela sp. CCAP 1560/4]|eukprot:KNH09595.1 hypothetical protein XU18_0280 [Perkinsela sp. CCAP 1560/4]